ERTEFAQRVTSELLALKPYVVAKPIAPQHPSVTETRRDVGKPVAELLRISYPCVECYSTSPLYYCDACKAESDRQSAKKRDRELRRDRQAQRERRRRRRLARRAICICCGDIFGPSRRDAKYCSNACRQRAHRTGAAGVRD